MSNKPLSDMGGSILLVIHTRIRNNLIHQILICATNRTFKRIITMDSYNQNIESVTNWFEVDTTEIT